MNQNHLTTDHGPSSIWKARRAFSCQWSVVSGLLLLVLLCGCASPQPVGPRRFEFAEDTFAYANELKWEYRFDENGRWSAARREPPPEYALHCFVLARTARQFFANTHFDATKPKADDETYRKLIRRIARSNPRKALPESEKIVVRGYANLREFSEAKEDLLKAECGGASRSYFQRGNWRMVFPFTRNGQTEVAADLVESLERDWPAIVHVVTFPNLSLNHAVLIFDAKESENEISFTAYDPNDPDEPIILRFDRAQRRFVFPRTKYFSGGPVNVYQIYCSWNR